MKKTLAPVLSFLLFLSFIVNVSQASPNRITSYGTIRYAVSTSAFGVNGTKIINEDGIEIRLKGFQLWGNKMFYEWFGLYTNQDFQQIRGWGFNVVRSDLFWGSPNVGLEPYEGQPGVYNEESLAVYEKYIKMAGEASLYYIFASRVQFNDTNPPSWAGWAKASYVCTPEGLDRYCRFIEWFVQKLDKYDNLVGYAPWMFPFHQSAPTEQERQFYYSTVMPRMVEAIRKHSNKIIFLSSLNCVPWEFNNFKPVYDKNVVYGFCFYWPDNHGGAEPMWNYNEQAQWDYVQSAREFQTAYGVPIHIVEFGIRFNNRQDQLDKLRLKLEILEQYGWSWLYWEDREDPEGGFGVLWSDGTPKQEILAVLTEYNKTEYG